GWRKSPACSVSVTAAPRLPFVSPKENATPRHPDVAPARETCRTGEVIMLPEKDGDIGTISVMGPFAAPPSTKYDRLVARAKEVPAATTVVVHPCDETSLRGPVEAAEAGIVRPILVGPAAKIAAVAREHGIKIDRFEIIDVAHSEAAAAKGVELVR